jgi:hypothetical protein
MDKNILLGIMMVVLLAGAVHATNAAALQVTNYSTIPATIYAGTVGQLQISMLNSGSDPASQVVVNYQTPSMNAYSQQSVGEIGAGSSAVVSIPFNVPQNVSSGFFIINLNIVYFGDDSHTGTKNTPVTVPVVVSEHQILAVNTISVTPPSIQAGDSLTAELKVTNTGGVMNNVMISIPDNSTFTLAGASQQTVGSIPFNTSKIVNVTISSSSATQTGRYTIPVTVSYQDVLQNTINQTVSVGPVSVSESSSQLRVSIAPETPAEAGSQTGYDITVQNFGSSPASAVIDVNQTEVFTPIGGSKLYFDNIPVGMNQTQTVTIGAGAATLAGYYSLPVTVTSNGQTYNQTFGIVVGATPNIEVSSSTQPAFVSSGMQNVIVLAQIANTGNGPIRSVYITTAPTKDLPIVGATDKFIGTLNIDDFAAFQITVNVPGNLAPGRYTIPINVTFKDSTNQDHRVQEMVPVEVYSSGEAAANNGLSGATGSTAGGFGGRTRGGGGLFGLSLIEEIVIGIVIIVIGFFAYKRYKGGKRQTAQGSKQ